MRGFTFFAGWVGDGGSQQRSSPQSPGLYAIWSTTLSPPSVTESLAAATICVRSSLPIYAFDSIRDRMDPRILKLKIAITAGLLAGFLLSPKLWLSARFYPSTPVLSFLKPLSFPFDYVVFLGMLLCLCVAGLF